MVVVSVRSPHLLKDGHPLKKFTDNPFCVAVPVSPFSIEGVPLSMTTHAQPVNRQRITVVAVVRLNVAPPILRAARQIRFALRARVGSDDMSIRYKDVNHSPRSQSVNGLALNNGQQLLTYGKSRPSAACHAYRQLSAILFTHRHEATALQTCTFRGSWENPFQSCGRYPKTRRSSEQLLECSYARGDAKFAVTSQFACVYIRKNFRRLSIMY